jgi:hypothetical protein
MRQCCAPWTSMYSAGQANSGLGWLEERSKEGIAMGCRSPRPLRAADLIAMGEGTDAERDGGKPHRPFAPVEHARRARRRGLRAGALAACGGASLICIRQPFAQGSDNPCMHPFGITRPPSPSYRRGAERRPPGTRPYAGQARQRCALVPAGHLLGRGSARRYAGGRYGRAGHMMPRRIASSTWDCGRC